MSAVPDDKPTLTDLLQDNANAVSHLHNGLYRDFKRDLARVVETAEALAKYYETEIYSGPE
jgi:hypothetical protein